MSSSRHASFLTPEELLQAVAKLAQFISRSNARFSISEGAASTIIHIDLVIQLSGSTNADSISAWLLENFPAEFVAKTQYGVTTPVITFKRHDGSVKHVEIEMFDYHAWPNRPQYNLDDPDNDCTVTTINGVEVPGFSARWLLREKIRTAFERQGSRKERSGLDDVSILLQAVEANSADLTGNEQAVQHLMERRPRVSEMLGLKVICPVVLGDPWTWNDSAEVVWGFKGDKLKYLDADVKRHSFKWDDTSQVWYFPDPNGRVWYYDPQAGDLILWT
ncbi:hypothetical protein NW754_005612 [Fusarium falciforme]|nr:hypothetical protein NW754_005612 [Fusarium falciforme]KAJ4251139.1 hypothetical protein NW757_006684 [Fusarium falciforme]